MFTVSCIPVPRNNTLRLKYSYKYLGHIARLVPRLAYSLKPHYFKFFHVTGYLCLAFTHLSSVSQDAFSHAWLYPRILFAYWMSHLLFPASLICQSALIDRCCVHIVHKRFSLPWNLPISLCWLARELRGSFFSTSHLCSDYRWALSFLALYVGAGDQAQVLTLIGHALSGPSHLSSPSLCLKGILAFWDAVVGNGALFSLLLSFFIAVLSSWGSGSCHSHGF